LKIFLQRFKRAYPDASAIWKLEPQKRGAPHYHMLVWGVEMSEFSYSSNGTGLPFASWVPTIWHQIAGHGDKRHFEFHAG